MNVYGPQPEEYPEWFAAEIEPVKNRELFSGLTQSFDETLKWLGDFDDDLLRFVYEPGKWTIKEIWQHVMDVERILAYRALRYARADETVLQGFDEKGYVARSNANQRLWSNMLDEYTALRTSTLALLRSFDEAMWNLRGTTGRSNMTVRAVGYLILGHETHHCRIIRERYIFAQG